ncbi:MAG TPA: TauD/TfdA family dioxygenase, partial [Stellaceae bacterium]|nr:TauD/TfdA family dioxygenase [Stellaceae bacterium]
MAQAASQLDVTRSPQAIEVIPYGATFGAEIRGIDFARPVDRSIADAVQDALAQHKVVWFRAAAMTPAQHVAFGRLFGELTVHPFVPHLDDHPEVVVLDNHKDNPVFSTDVWHSD